MLVVANLTAITMGGLSHQSVAADFAVNKDNGQVWITIIHVILVAAIVFGQKIIHFFKSFSVDQRGPNRIGFFEFTLRSEAFDRDVEFIPKHHLKIGNGEKSHPRARPAALAFTFEFVSLLVKPLGRGH